MRTCPAILLRVSLRLRLAGCAGVCGAVHVRAHVCARVAIAAHARLRGRRLPGLSETAALAWRLLHSVLSSRAPSSHAQFSPPVRLSVAAAPRAAAFLIDLTRPQVRPGNQSDRAVSSAGFRPAA